MFCKHGERVLRFPQSCTDYVIGCLHSNATISKRVVFSTHFSKCLSSCVRQKSIYLRGVNYVICFSKKDSSKFYIYYWDKSCFHMWRVLVLVWKGNHTWSSMIVWWRLLKGRLLKEQSLERVWVVKMVYGPQ